MPKQEILIILNLLRIVFDEAVFVKFSDDQAGLKAMRSSYLSRQSPWVPNENCKAEIQIKKILASLSIMRTQIPLKLTWTSTVHKVQSLNLQVLTLNCKIKNHLDQGKYILYSVG